MKFILNKDKLTVENEESANSGSVQYYEVDVEHDDSWDDLTIEAVIVPKEGGTLIFDDAESIAEIDNKIYIDRELSGSYAIGFKGFTIENEVKVYQISTNLQGVYFNVGAGQIITTNSIPKPTEWEIYVAQIEAIANRASQSADDAQTSAENAETSAENAQASAETATEQAESASTSANTATDQAGIATTQAGIAITKAGEASTSATNAKTSEDNAKASEQSASGSAESASASATSAGNSASSAATSASLASSSEGVASQKAGEASASASSASASASSAEQSKNTAQGLVNGFNTTVETATNAFNTNATEKTNAFNTNATNKTDTFNDNATSKTTAFNENATQKTTDFNTNASDKTTEFNEVVDTAKDDIEEIAPMLQKKMSKIPSMMQDKTATGTSIHTEDSADWYGKLNFEGFSRQETTTGANKMKFTERSIIGGQSEVDYVCNSQGQVTITGTASKEVGFTYNQEAVVLNAGTYKFKAIGNYDGVRFRRTDTNSLITLNNNGEGTVVIDNDNTSFKILVYILIGTTYNCDFYITLAEGETATTERYTGGIPQPNIDYPSEIRNLESINKFKPIPSQTKNGVTLTYNTDGSYTLNGTATASANIALEAQSLEAGNYSLQCQYEGTLPNNSSPRVQVYSENASFVLSVSNNANKNSIVNLSLSSNVTDVIFRIRIENGFNYENVKLYPMLLKGTYTTAKLYAPYDSLRFKQAEKNVAKISDLAERNFIGATLSVEKGIIKLNGTTTSTQNKVFDVFTAQSGNAVFSVEVSGYTDRASENTSMLLQQSDNGIDFTILEEILLTSTKPKTKNVILDENKYYRIRLFTASHTYNNTEIKVQLEYGTAKTDFEPYKEHNTDFPLEGQKMYAGSTLTDNGIQHTRKQLVLDGTEDGWSIGNMGTENFYYRYRYLSDRIAKQSSNTNDLCNRFTITTISSSNTNEGLYILVDGEIRIRFGIQKTIAEFKAWLAENPLTIEYELAEPETVPYTQAQQDAYDELQNLETYQYVNNIELIANEETNMTFDYKKDIQMQIAERDTEIENIKSRLALLE